MTGFLGAGKTTLLNRILNGEHGLRVGVLVNDFGAVNIDAALITGVEENTISLANGCVCCEVRDDLITSLEDLLRREEQVDYVILEASGVADPEGVVMTFLDTKYEPLLRLDTITCIVDAEALFSQQDDAELAMLKLRQIGFADLVVLNKVDLVTADHVAAIREWIDGHFSRVRIVEAEYADVPLEVLLSAGRFDAGGVGELLHDGAGGASHQHDDPGFETFHYQSREPISVKALRKTIKKLPASVYRAKGFVIDAERPDRRTVVQAVGRRSTITVDGAWEDGPAQTDLVVIGRDLDRQQLRESFDACAA